MNSDEIDLTVSVCGNIRVRVRKDPIKENYYLVEPLFGIPQFLYLDNFLLYLKTKLHNRCWRISNLVLLIQAMSMLPFNIERTEKALMRKTHKSSKFPLEKSNAAYVWKNSEINPKSFVLCAIECTGFAEHVTTEMISNCVLYVDFVRLERNIDLEFQNSSVSYI